MQLFKQIIQKNYDLYQTELANGRLFPGKLLQASTLARVIMKNDKNIEFPRESVEMLNKLYMLLWALPVPHTKKKIQRDDFKNETDFKEQRNRTHEHIKLKVYQKMSRHLKAEEAIVHRFMLEYAHVAVKQEPMNIMSHIPGTIGVISTNYTYDRQTRRRSS